MKDERSAAGWERGTLVVAGMVGLRVENGARVISWRGLAGAHGIYSRQKGDQVRHNPG